MRTSLSGHAGRVDGHDQVAAVGQHGERLVERRVGQVAAHAHVDDRDAVVGQLRTAVHRVDVGGVNPLLVEILLVEVADVRRDEVGELAFGLEILCAGVSLAPEFVEDLSGVTVVREVRGRVGEAVVDRAELVLEQLEESVEGVVALSGRGVAGPHRGADVLGQGLAEEFGLGLFEDRSGEVLHVDVDDRGDLLVDHREVVGGGESEFGLYALEVDRLFGAGGGCAAVPAGGGELLEDVALSVPELDVGGLGHVVEHAHAKVLGRLPGQDRAEEDVLQIGAGVLFRIFKVSHGVFVFLRVL